jgi:hypothetical protein
VSYDNVMVPVVEGAFDPNVLRGTPALHLVVGMLATYLQTDVVSVLVSVLAFVATMLGSHATVQTPGEGAPFFRDTMRPAPVTSSLTVVVSPSVRARPIGCGVFFFAYAHAPHAAVLPKSSTCLREQERRATWISLPL